MSRYPSPESTTNKTKWIAQTALFLALTLVLPIGFHAFGIAGRVFLPMHIPVLLAGFLVGPAAGLVVGLMSPAVLYLSFAMPPAYAVLPMTLELTTYGLVAGMAYKRLRMNIYVSLVIAMVVGRLMFGLGLLVLGRFMDLPYTATVFFSSTGPMIAGLPGIVLQIFLIPLIVAAVRRNRS